MASEFLKQNKTEEEIVQELRLVCNFFPTGLKDQVILKVRSFLFLCKLIKSFNFQFKCNSFITEYGPYVIQLISDEIDPNIACESLKLCEVQQVQKKKFASFMIHFKLRY
jgi:hypothetical protein